MESNNRGSWVFAKLVLCKWRIAVVVAATTQSTLVIIVYDALQFLDKQTERVFSIPIVAPCCGPSPRLPHVVAMDESCRPGVRSSHAIFRDSVLAVSLLRA